jgi:mannose-6-phosphate isomerase-like protein (cupin superfamily)
MTVGRYGLDPYLDWVKAEGLPIAEGWAVDLFEVETRDWPRYGVRGAAAHLHGRGDNCSMFVIDIPAGRSTSPQHHLYEEVFCVLAGHGSTQIEFPDGTTRSFEWGKNSLFSLPLNARHRHFNGSGSQRALLSSTTNLPMVLNLFHNERFVFDVDFAFDDRIGKKDYYTGGGELTIVAPGANFWETNFVPDVSQIELTDWADRGAGGTNIVFVLADGSMHAHTSEMPAGTYKKAHRHQAGTHVMCLTGHGYSLLWYEGDTDYTRIEWKHGVVFPPGPRQFHQHFTTSAVPARYVAANIGSIRYPLTREQRLTALGEDGAGKPGAAVSVKDGGDQIEYEDQDPRIHAWWLEEMRKNNVTPRMEKYIRS